MIAGDRSVLLKLDKSISIVGSRQPTNYGLQLSYSLASQASLAQLVVVSGGAYGIDTASHQGALSVGGLSIAVLAGGINRLYPLENQKLLIQKEEEVHNKSLAKNQFIGELQGELGLKEKDALNSKIESLMKQLEFKDIELKTRSYK